eukprot:Gregarina_sp_Pseudo_9__3289@NODE_346_length_3097_cov_8_513734_g326_i0_p1_GENE_NODE_346_length_3097_cov_8_513734_g326_i0NODE_346_length_3097_cov_8_513734_g326_i0_p1_ORF_typecomplete_len520_score131_74TPR_11/PF13414_6/1_2e07TPR_11/PF13414_6/1_5TPR_11/PF13414_6/0_038TPR_1/PF00515_28/0_00032TPR_1/PF00515_28/0_047TPR_1/PF00515_28/0_14TPR_2/PF07719_17/0_00027TPR_2/PF07719_17/5_3TPR_2/PF07719_17/0_095TPR_MalT/PF17874_1/2_4e10TPR_16/PF13432_6/0_011TPR_16/PF13432_6/0_00011TPR_12/PF13424_6/6_4e07TPR_12/PF
MQVRWERSEQPSAFVCIALILLSLALFSWRVYILVVQRFQKEQQRISERHAAKQQQATAHTPHAAQDDTHVHKEAHTQCHTQDRTPPASPTHTGSTGAASDAGLKPKEKVSQEAGARGSEARKETANSQPETANSQPETAVGEAGTPHNRDVPRSRLDVLDEIVSDFSEDATAEEKEAGDDTVVRKSSVCASPGTRLRRASSEALLHSDGIRARGDVDDVEEASDLSEHGVTAPAADMPSTSPFQLNQQVQNDEASVSHASGKDAEDAREEDRDAAYQSGDGASPKDGDAVSRAAGASAETAETPAGALEDAEPASVEMSEDETSDEDRPGAPPRSDAEAERLKLLGNEKYTQKQFDEAIELYSKAIDMCPRRSKTLAAILFCNMAAVHYSQSQWAECIQCCTDSLELDGSFVKAYIRRSRANKAFEKYGDALADLKKALELDSSLVSVHQKEVAALEVLANEQFEKEKAEMIGKLKDFGSWALGKVGMSLDHFKVIQDPVSGGYNIQYQPPDQPPSDQ